MSLHLSAGAEPAHAAAWLEGFLNRNAVVLLHDPTVWGLVDEWLAGLADEHFIRVLPLVRRTFSAFGATDLRDLSQKAAQRPRRGGASAGGQGAGAAASPAAVEWDESRAVLPLPLLRRLMGLPPASGSEQA